MGVHYWGLNLEGSAPTQRFPWQCPTGTALLQRLSDPQASEQLPDGATALCVWRWRLAKRSIPTSEPWPLMIERIATSSIHHCGKRTPRRMRQSGSALRKLIRSLVAPGVVAGCETEEEGQCPRRSTQARPQGELYWGRLRIGPGGGAAGTARALAAGGPPHVLR